MPLHFNVPVILPMAVPSTKTSFLMWTLGCKTASQSVIEKGKEDIWIRIKALTKPHISPEKMYKSFRKQSWCEN